jgi:nitrogen regulatory protein P-II 1
MTKIEAYIRTQRLEEVQEALEAADVSGMTVTEVRGMGRSKGVTHTYRGSQYTLSLNPRLKLEIVVTDDQVAEVVDAIQKAATTNEVGDGKILIIPLADVIRIRTGERGDASLA